MAGEQRHAGPDSPVVPETAVGHPRNRVDLSGVLVAPPELRVTPSGLTVATLELQHLSREGAAGPAQSLELRIPVVAIGPLAEPCRRLAVGTALEVEGRLNQKRWIRDGKVRWGRTELLATNLRTIEA